MSQIWEQNFQLFRTVLFTLRNSNVRYFLKRFNFSIIKV